MSKSFIIPSKKLTPEAMFDLVTKNDKIGIEGYLCPKQYFDYQNALWVKKRAEILTKHKAVWPPENWKTNKATDKKEPPKRLNFIDEQIKWAKSFYNPVKSQEIKEALEAKGQKIGLPNPYKSDFDIKPNKINLFNEFKQRESELKKVREQINSIPEYKQNAIEEVKSKLEKNEHKPKVGKSSWSKGDRVMYNEDNKYLGELYPFWNPNSKEENTKKAEFFPNKIKIMYKSPSWTFAPKKQEQSSSGGENKASEFIKARDERLEEKAKAVLDKMGVEKKNYMLDPIGSYRKVKEHGSLSFIFRKVFDYANTEQYKASLEKRHSETPAPNSYWDDGKSKIKLRKNIDDEQAHKYVMPREKTYKRQYCSGLRKSVF